MEPQETGGDRIVIIEFVIIAPDGTGIARENLRLSRCFTILSKDKPRRQPLLRLQT